MPAKAQRRELLPFNFVSLYIFVSIARYQAVEWRSRSEKSRWKEWSKKSKRKRRGSSGKRSWRKREGRRSNGGDCCFWCHSYCLNGSTPPPSIRSISPTFLYSTVSSRTSRPCRRSKFASLNRKNPNRYTQHNLFRPLILYHFSFFG